MTRLHELDIHEAAQRIGSGELSPVAVVEACLARIEALQPRLNAFIAVLAEEAREHARRCETEIRQGQWQGPLHGIPLAVKDFYDVAGVPTTAASKDFGENPAERDAPGVARLTKAGAIVIGKSNMHEMGEGTSGLAGAFGPVRNPWSQGHVPGGSSSGSAAAVATGQAFGGFDTDAVGSCRLPAACCGVVGFKGTFGLVDGGGILGDAPPPDEMIRWLAHPALTARTVCDVAILLDALVEGGGYAQSLDEPETLRLGVVRNARAEGEVAANFAKAVERLRGLGHPLRDADLPDVDPMGDLSRIEDERAAFADQAFRDADVFVLPTLAAAVPTLAEAGGDPMAVAPDNTIFANYYGLPAISVPSGLDARGLPLGLQIVGRPGRDATVLRLAHRFQRETQDDGPRLPL